MSGVATAATMYPNEVLTVEKDKTVTWTNYDNMQNGDAASPLVKDGEGTLRFEKVQGSRSDYYKAPLVAREGKVEVVDSTMYAHGAYVPNPYATTWIMVGGKNAEMSFTNSSFNIATGETHMNVGTADGNGTLSLDKTNMKITGSVFTGYHSYANNEDSWGLGYYYNYNGTAATDDIPAENQNPKSTEHRYTEGSYTDGYNGQNRKFGEGTINVTNGSTLDVATAFTMGYATLNVSGKGSLVKTQTGYGGIVQDDSDYVDTYAVILGRWSGAESKISITDGARMEMDGQLRTVRSSSLVNTKSTVEVSGKGSELMVKATANLGIYNTSGKNTTTVKAVLGGTLNFAKAVLGYDVDMSIGEGSFYNGTSLHMKSDSVIVTNSGLMTVESVLVEGGLLTNSGTIAGDITVDGGTFTMADDAVAAGLTATSGTINLSGNVTFTGAVSLGGSVSESSLALLGGDTETLTVYIAKDTNIVLDDSILSVDGQQFVVGDNTEIIVDLGNVAYEEGTQLFTLSGSDGTLLTDTAAALEDKVKVTWMDEESGTRQEASGNEVSGSIATVVVPEPTTATLSLLALCGLCARRRRK